MHKFFNCIIIVFATIMFVSCNGKELAKEAEEKVVAEFEKDTAKKDRSKIYIYDYDDSTAYSNRYRDTIDVEARLSDWEEGVLELKKLHVKSLADTVFLEDKLSKIFAFFDNDSTYVDMDPDRLLHSQKVRFCQAFLSYFDECLRLNEELISVGYPKAKSFEEDDDAESMLELRDAIQEALYRELN